MWKRKLISIDRGSVSILLIRAKRMGLKRRMLESFYFRSESISISFDSDLKDSLFDLGSFVLTTQVPLTIHNGYIS